MKSVLFAAFAGIAALCYTAIQQPAGAIAPLPVVDSQFAAPECPPRGLTVDATIVRVIDGDTVVCRTCVEYHVRLLDCWAPESRTKDKAEKTQGLQSKARLQQLATPDAKVRVHIPTATDLSDVITLGRVLGRVWPMAGDVPQSPDFSTIMVTEGLATPQKIKKADK